jgi:hypothetical protein
MSHGAAVEPLTLSCEAQKCSQHRVIEVHAGLSDLIEDRSHGAQMTSHLCMQNDAECAADGDGETRSTLSCGQIVDYSFASWVA